MAGRIEGKKNLRYEGNKIINQNGVAFTDKEKKTLEYLVNSANRKRKRLSEQEDNLPFKTGGIETGASVKQLKTLGYETDFLMAKKSKSLQRFKSKKEYTKYIRQLKKVLDPKYLDKKADDYRKNYIKKVRNVFGGDGKEIIKKLMGMTGNEFASIAKSDEALHLSYLYGPDHYIAKLKQVKGALGILENTKKVK